MRVLPKGKRAFFLVIPEKPVFFIVRVFGKPFQVKRPGFYFQCRGRALAYAATPINNPNRVIRRRKSLKGARPCMPLENVLDRSVNVRFFNKGFFFPFPP